jgi:ABC-2 type transport system ATP-binding protein
LEEKQVIEVKNVTKKYGNFLAVDNISFTVNDGEVVGFLGPNGAGKSTTMNMITGFIEPTEGSITINGFDVHKDAAIVKKQLGYMPEGVPLYTELTVKEFVSYMAELKRVPRKERKEKVENVLKETGLTDVSKKLIKNLSRGYKQRVSLAGALIGDPKVIILDEPTVGLDPKQITDIRELIKGLGKKHTVILSSHILSEVSQICEKVIIINKGKIVAIDTPESLENKTQRRNTLLITVEDKENNMANLKKDIPEIKTCKMVKDNNDGTKQYMVESATDVDLRKKMFEVLPKKNITIFELKKTETSLEDAFITLIEKNTKERAAEEKAAKEEKESSKDENKKAEKKEKKLESKEEKKEDKKQEAKKENKEEKKSETEVEVKEEKTEEKTEEKIEDKAEEKAEEKTDNEEQKSENGGKE